MNDQEKYLVKAQKILKLKNMLIICLAVSIITLIASFILLNINGTYIMTYLNSICIITAFVAIVGYVYYKLFSANIIFYCQHYDNNPDGVKRKVRLSYFGAGLCIFAFVISIIEIILYLLWY